MTTCTATILVIALGHVGRSAASVSAPAAPHSVSRLRPASAPIHNGGAGLLQIQARSGSSTSSAHGVTRLTLRNVDPVVLGSPNGEAPWLTLEGARSFVNAWDVEFRHVAPTAALLVRQRTGLSTVIIVSLRHPRLDGANTLSVDATRVATPGSDWGPLLSRGPRRSSIPPRLGAVSLLLDAAGACTSGLTLEVYNGFYMQAFSPGTGLLTGGTWLQRPDARNEIVPMNTGIWTACGRTPYSKLSGELTILGPYGGVTTIHFNDIPGPHAHLSSTSDGSTSPSGQILPSNKPRFLRYLISLRPTS